MCIRDRCKVEEVFEEKKLDFSKIDLVINATGIDNLGFILNDFFNKNYFGKPLIHSWVEPLGLGGHILISNNNKNAGCLRCLFKNDKKFGLVNEFSLVEPGQNFRKSISGCSTRFTPYGSIDAIRTAIETVKYSIEILKGKELSNPLISWYGSCLLYTSPSPRDATLSRMPSSA